VILCLCVSAFLWFRDSVILWLCGSVEVQGILWVHPLFPCFLGFPCFSAGSSQPVSVREVERGKTVKENQGEMQFQPEREAGFGLAEQ